LIIKIFVVDYWQESNFQKSASQKTVANAGLFLWLPNSRSRHLVDNQRKKSNLGRFWAKMGRRLVATYRKRKGEEGLQ